MSDDTERLCRTCRKDRGEVLCVGILFPCSCEQCGRIWPAEDLAVLRKLPATTQSITADIAKLKEQIAVRETEILELQYDILDLEEQRKEARHK